MACSTLATPRVLRASSSTSPLAPVRSSIRAARACRLQRLAVRASAEKSVAERLALPAAAVLGAALLLAGTPEEALAARSGGRVGGSSFSSRPRRWGRRPAGGGAFQHRGWRHSGTGGGGGSALGDGRARVVVGSN